jgi:hydroxymethylglutaryl-CoA lyase
MQGLSEFISTADKVVYINKLLKVGFDTIDFGSFVSPKAIPQMRDTAEVLSQLEWRHSKSKLLAIVANVKGAEDASTHEGITYLGFPLSISETFQKRNTNKSIAEALSSLEEIQNICIRSGKELVTYISMGFGNPYNDPYDVKLVAQFVDILATLGLKIISLADTIGVSTPATIDYLFSTISQTFPHIEFGAHLHSTPDKALEKIQSAFDAGCLRFDGAMRGFGGCPMAKDDLVGNLATETLVGFLHSRSVVTSLNENEFLLALGEADRIFKSH